MKTVIIDGKEYEVPDEATCYAMNSNGEWRWHTQKPSIERFRGAFDYWFNHGKIGYICSSTYWKTTLTMIESEGE